MLRLFLFFIISFVSLMGKAQTTAVSDSVQYGVVTVQKDSRIDLLGEKMYEYNIALSKKIRSGKGFRLMLMSTNDRNAAMNVRAKLLQMYPEHKVYMAYQNPFIKLKMGNFEDRADAEKFRKQLMAQKLVPGNIYILPETIEIKPSNEETVE
ncbi:MAG TPA: SPOR domain-containing protein [Ferruginibacter sp.]|nr:SPOR domain-containing protein [Ferruginibacter sp.]HRE63044.1 SPOR domain-containing protein [Ferruginibacter sp.]